MFHTQCRTYGNVSVVTPLDLSAAFNTIDHTILLQRLEHVFWHTQYCSTLVFFLPLKRNSKLLLSTTVALPQHPSFVESHRDLFWALLFLSYILHPSLMLSTATLSFTLLLLTTLSCRNLPRHDSLMNSFSPCRSASMTLSRG